jgi:GTP cyclohydrolase IA
MESNNAATRPAVGRQERPLDNYEAVKKTFNRAKGILENSFEYIGGEMITQARAELLMGALTGIEIPEETAYRMAKWLGTFANVTEPSVEEIFGGAFELGEGTGMVIEKDISVIALCEHHMLPFMGRAAIGYIPHKKVVGLSKMKRLIDALTMKPTMQELITHRAASIMDEYLSPHGVMVVMYDMVHMCLSSRGVKDEHANTTTSAVRGVFAPGHEEAPAARGEFLSLLQV